MKIFRSKLFWFIVAIIVIACALMIFSAVFGKPLFLSNALNSVVSPIQKAASSVGGFFSNIVNYFYKYNDLEVENEALREKIAEYEKLEGQYYEAINENIRLRELAKLLEKHEDFVCEPAEVISYSGNPLAMTYTINKGSVSGIEAGDSVVTNAGLVGRVTAVGLNYSEVLLITDMTSSVAALVTRTREAVVAEGSYELASKHRLKLSYLSRDKDLKVGDLIETSGYGEIFPQGIYIGRVVEIGTEAHGISDYAIVEPMEDFTTLTSVFVVKDFEIIS